MKKLHPKKLINFRNSLRNDKICIEYLTILKYFYGHI